MPNRKRHLDNAGKLEDPPFVERYKDGQKRGIKLEDGTIGTHKLSYAEQDGKYIVYPNIQPIDYNNPNSQLYDYEDNNWTALDRAIRYNDTLQFNNEQEARDYTQHYKDFGREGYLLNIPYNINLPKPRLSLKNGGNIYIKPSHRGRFTALKERTGHSTTWFKENGTPAQKKMATFALNAAKWKH